MTQGAPRNTRTTPKKTDAPDPIEPGPGDETFDIDAWLGQRDLLGRRLMKIGGEWFEFDRSATSDQLIAYGKVQTENLMAAVAELLSDPARKEALEAAVDRQRNPIPTELQQSLLRSIADFIIFGDAEHTAKAEQDEKKATMGESSAS